MTRDIATIITEKTVNPETNRPYTVTMIEKAMNDLHISVNPNKNPKQQVPRSFVDLLPSFCGPDHYKYQALDFIKQLVESNIVPIRRAQMRVRVAMPSKEGKRMKQKVMDMVSAVEDEDWGQEWDMVIFLAGGLLTLY
jgi:ribosome maturation protein SDO1